MKPVLAKFRTFEEAEAATRDYYLQLTPAERLEILFQLRAMAHKQRDATSGRLARVYRIAQLQRGCYVPEALILNKRVTGRAKDKADLEALGASEEP